MMQRYHLCQGKLREHDEGEWVKLSEVEWAPRNPDAIVTHWDGCWKCHLGCAMRRIKEFEAEVALGVCPWCGAAFDPEISSVEDHNIAFECKTWRGADGGYWRSPGCCDGKTEGKKET